MAAGSMESLLERDVLDMFGDDGNLASWMSVLLCDLQATPRQAGWHSTAERSVSLLVFRSVGLLAVWCGVSQPNCGFPRLAAPSSATNNNQTLLQTLNAPHPAIKWSFTRWGGRLAFLPETT
jgi:hypothetical protein